MAFSTTKATSYPRRGVVQTVWTMKDTAGDSVAEQFPAADSITLHATGTPASATIAVQASNDPAATAATFVALPTAVSWANTTGVKSIALTDLGFQHYRLSMTGGGGTTDMTVTAVATGLKV